MAASVKQVTIDTETGALVVQRIERAKVLRERAAFFTALRGEEPAEAEALHSADAYTLEALERMEGP